MKKCKKLSITLCIILCMSTLLSGSVFAASYTKCPHCSYSIITTSTTQNVGNMIITSCTHGYAHQKDIIQPTTVTTSYQCKRCPWFDSESHSSSYLVGHLLYTD